MVAPTFTDEQRAALCEVLAADNAPPRILIADDENRPRYYALNADGDVVEVS